MGLKPSSAAYQPDCIRKSPSAYRASSVTWDLVTKGLPPSFLSPDTLPGPWTRTSSNRAVNSLLALGLSPGAKCRSIFSSVCAKLLQSCPALCDPMDCSLPGPSVHGIFQEECWSGLPFSSSGDLPNTRIEPRSLMSPVLASGFFTTSTTWDFSHLIHPKSEQVWFALC